MFNMEIVEGLQKMQDMGIRELNIYWMEDIEEGSDCWWCDVHEDMLDELCDMNWAWTIEDIKSYEQDSEEIDGDPPDWQIVVPEPFSGDVVCSAVKKWLDTRGFDFNVKIIDIEGTVGWQHIVGLQERLATIDKELKTLDSISRGDN